MHRLFCLLLSLLMLPVAAYAEDISGTLFHQGDKLLISLKDRLKPYKLYSRNAYVRLDLAKMQTGDLISGDGIIHAERNEVELSTIDFVGLKKLLGFWVSETSEIFEFEDFNRLNLYTSHDRFVIDFKKVRYTIAPDSGGAWSILIVDDDSVDVGRLSFQEKQLTIDFYIGKAIKTIQLKPMSWKQLLNHRKAPLLPLP